MSELERPFDRAVVRRHRERAAAGWPRHDFLVREVADRLADRLGDIRRAFPLALDLGCHGGELAQAIAGRNGIETVVACDLAQAMARRAALVAPALAADEEALPFAAGGFDLVASALSLHWVNDLPGTLLQVRRMLRPDGLFLAALLGGETLAGLRAALVQADTETGGGAIGPRVSPFADLRDCGGLLQRAGFALPVVDSDLIEVTYPDALALMRELRGMGESGALTAGRKSFTRRETLLRAAELYAEHFAGPDGRVAATFQVVYLTGWAPHASQQKPLRPGSAAQRLAEALGTAERPAGDKADPGTDPGHRGRSPGKA
ncbi:Methyltransferase domain-containing protein [Tistlia consotensis]|uniref:Methyltransferase domain-containing protein n=1 Tax=Tistlia consotensis USBA 355 TaxID=560819 RepID=A0A1Y6C4I2_9PROT|nr:methyltransferase domain-containing protein [Tistlia consotensis]SMF33650.1 Methyltransferase domain-containing protein [Tistlia consotensis USBA 355]SNR70030.1 Methyltransferase domain-containing protein [Tistlia consotensis]